MFKEGNPKGNGWRGEPKNATHTRQHFTRLRTGGKDQGKDLDFGGRQTNCRLQSGGLKAKLLNGLGLKRKRKTWEKRRLGKKKRVLKTGDHGQDGPGGATGPHQKPTSAFQMGLRGGHPRKGKDWGKTSVPGPGGGPVMEGSGDRKKKLPL